MTRICISYTDTLQRLKPDQGVHVRLRRADDADGDTKGTSEQALNPNKYDKGHVFFESVFPQTWSGNGLVHHRCGDWIPAAEISCGYSWSNTCILDVGADKGGYTVLVQQVNFEVGIRPIH